MQRTRLLIASCAAAAAACLLYLSGGDGAASLPRDPSQDGRATQGAPAAIGGAEDQELAAARGRAVAADAGRGPDLDHPHAFSVRVRALDEWGLPASGRRIRLAPIGCSRNILDEETDSDGVATLQWRARQPHMRIALAVGHGGAREFDVEAGTTRELVVLPGRQSGGFSFRIEGGGGLSLGDMGRAITLDGSTLTQRFASVGDDDGEVRAAVGMHPHARFADRLLPGWSPAESDGGATESTQLGIQLSAGAFSFVMGQGERESNPGFGVIQGMVFGEDGKPAANQNVVYGVEDGRPLHRTTTEQDGAFKIPRARLGPVFVRAGGGAAGLAQESALVVDQGPTTVRLHLRRGQRIHGRAVGEEQKPLSGWWVCYEALDGSWVDRTKTNEDGSYLLANLPAGAGRVLLCEQPTRVPSAIAASVLPDSGPVDFVLAGDAAPRGGIKAVLLEPLRSEPTPQSQPTQPRPARLELDGLTIAASGSGPGSVSLHGWHLGTGLGFRIPRADDGSFQCGGLPAGYYRVEMHDLGIGWVDLGQHYVDGKGTVDLGVIQRPATGTLAISGRPPHTTIELYRRMPWGDAQAAQEFGERTEAELPVGTWLLFQRTVDLAPEVREFEIRPGQTSTVALGG